MEYTEKTIQDILRNHFMSPNSVKYRIDNLMVYGWESDSLSITKSDYVYECEIKISRSDFFNDKKKERKHLILEGKYEMKWYEKNEVYTYPPRPNYFYYAVPENLIKIEEIPSYAGLLYITDKWPYVITAKKAPKIHGDKIDYELLRMRDKFYYNYIEWKIKAEKTYKNELTELKQQLNEARFDEEGNKYQYTIGEANKRVEEYKMLYDLEKKYNKEKDEAIHKYITYVNDLKCMLYERGVERKELRDMWTKIMEEYS